MRFYTKNLHKQPNESLPQTNKAEYKSYYKIMVII